MAVIEIVGGVILLVVSVVIFALTLMQHTHGQGLAGVINGSAYGANNARLTPADQMLAKVTRIAGIIFFYVLIRYGYDYTIMGLKRMSTAINIPQAYFFMCIPLSGCFMMWYTILDIVSDVKKMVLLVNGKKEVNNG